MGERASMLVRGVRILGVLIAGAVECMVHRPKNAVEAATWIHRVCRRLVEEFGVICDVQGYIPESGAVVCNHMSYLDILTLLSVRPFIMVAKTEVRGWPYFGWMTAQAGTVYVKRGGGPATWPGVNAAMAAAYATGLPVLFFPEGTTSNGQFEEGGVMPFRRGLFHSVLNGNVPLRVAALRYTLGEDNDGATVANDVCWWGEASLMPHLLRFLSLRGVRARVRFGDEVTARADRFVLSETARAAVQGIYAELGTELGAGLEAASGDTAGAGVAARGGYESELVEAL